MIFRISPKRCGVVVSGVLIGLGVVWLGSYLAFGSLSAFYAYIHGKNVLVELRSPINDSANFGDMISIPCRITNLTSQELSLEGISVSVPAKIDQSIPCTLPPFGKIEFDITIGAIAVQKDPTVRCEIKFYTDLNNTPIPEITVVININNAPATLPASCRPRNPQ
jgi:hypothetical protein